SLHHRLERSPPSTDTIIPSTAVAIVIPVMTNLGRGRENEVSDPDENFHPTDGHTYQHHNQPYSNPNTYYYYYYLFSLPSRSVVCGESLCTSIILAVYVLFSLSSLSACYLSSILVH